MPETVLFVALAYLIGSVPFAFLFAKRKGYRDLRLVGSGNVGATNAFRVAGSGAGLLTVLFDIAKGATAVVAAQRLGAGQSLSAVAGVAAVAGHIYPVWLGFRGGKGVAATCGAFAVLAPVATALAAAVFGIVAGLTRTISLGSMTAAVCLGPVAYAVGAPVQVVRAAFFAGCLVLFNHRSNLSRLVGGVERQAEGQDAKSGDRS
ncbi:MAG: glycerol-3-phosphate 1-O-acyltransferase PlsY [Acidobacteria bacterium]|nr:glycerol-3-phosphate 1-O-acyltransferase PlsY [Acidobacteriota bacterium]